MENKKSLPYATADKYKPPDKLWKNVKLDTKEELRDFTKAMAKQWIGCLRFTFAFKYNLSFYYYYFCYC